MLQSILQLANIGSEYRSPKKFYPAVWMMHMAFCCRKHEKSTLKQEKYVHTEVICIDELTGRGLHFADSDDFPVKLYEL